MAAGRQKKPRGERDRQREWCGFGVWEGGRARRRGEEGGGERAALFKQPDVDVNLFEFRQTELRKAWSGHCYR